MNPPFILLALASFTSAELVDVTLTLTPASASENTLDLTLNVSGFGSADSSQASGTIEARIDIAPDTGEISSLELISGDVSATGVNFRATTGFGFITVYDITTTTLGATVVTPSPPASVVGGQSAAELHDLTIDEGTLDGTSLAGPIPPQDFATTNVTGSGTPGSFVTITSAASTDSTSTTLVYDIDLTLPVAIEQLIEEEGISGTITANGTVRALGQVSLPVAPVDPYLVWATANGNAAALFEENSFSPLLPNGLFWALGYDAGDSPNHLEANGTGSSSFILTPAAGGTAADIAVQLSLDLSDPDAWTTITTIPAGTSTLQGPFGGGSGPAFLRLSTNAPSP